MSKHWLSLLMIAGISLTCWPQSRSNPCADYNQHLSYLKHQIRSLRAERAKQVRNCGDSAACRDLDDLWAGRLSIAEQTYRDATMAGCPQPYSLSELDPSATPANAKTSSQAKSALLPAQSQAAGNKQSAPPAIDHRQQTQPANSGLQAQPRMSQQGGAAQANGQARMMGGSSPAPAASASAASTGAQRPK